LVFDGTLQTINQNDIAGLTIRSITFNTSLFAISGQAITLTGSIVANNSGNSNDIQLNIRLVGTVTVSHADVTTPPIVLSGVLSGMGGLTLKGPGQLILQGAASNTYAGITRVAAGTLTLNKSVGVAVPKTLFIGDGIGSAGEDVVSLGTPNQIANSA